MLKLYKEAKEHAKQMENDLITYILDKHPILDSITVYSPTNISVASINFSLDIYEYREYTPADLSMKCKINNSTIPTEEEAIKHVNDLRREKKQFWDAGQAVHKMMQEEAD